MDVTGLTLNLPQLADELTTAGITVTSLSRAGNELLTADGNGHLVDLPSGAAAVIAAHVAAPEVDPVVPVDETLFTAATTAATAAAASADLAAVKTALANLATALSAWLTTRPGFHGDDA
jgi:hypothetical protein